jgi:hypothetical protein
VIRPPGRSTDLSVLEKSPDRFWRPPAVIFKDYQWLFYWVKASGAEADNSSTHGTEVKNGWSSISTLPPMPSWHAGTTLPLRMYGFEIWCPVQIK